MDLIEIPFIKIELSKLNNTKLLSVRCVVIVAVVNSIQHDKLNKNKNHIHIHIHIAIGVITLLCENPHIKLSTARVRIRTYSHSHTSSKILFHLVIFPIRIDNRLQNKIPHEWKRKICVVGGYVPNQCIWHESSTKSSDDVVEQAVKRDKVIFEFDFEILIMLLIVAVAIQSSLFSLFLLSAMEHIRSVYG